MPTDRAQRRATPPRATAPADRSLARARMTSLLLFAAGIVEVTWALSLKPTNGFTRLWPTARSIVLMFAAVYLLTLAMRSLPVGTAYAVFTGIGSVGTVLFGIVVAGDPPSLSRLGPIGLIVAGIILLRLFAEH